MTQTPVRLPRRFRSALVAAGMAAAALFSGVSGAQINRLATPPTSLEPRADLPNTVSSRVKSATVVGHLPGETALGNLSLVIKPSATQQADLAQLLVDQQNPSSAQFHKWLTPAQFGARFGLSDADLAKVESWLSSQGFTVTSVAAGRNRIHFSGTASAVEAAFGTTINRFHTDSQDYFENNSDLTVPASLADVVSGVSGMSSYHIAPPVRNLTSLSPQYTTTGGYHYLVPWDFRQIYSVNKLISQGYDGTGMTIGVIGQTSISTAQIGYFQQNTGVAVKAPTLTLVPGTGTSGQLSTGDEGESELDIEYAGGTAPGATINFIYTGISNTNNGGVLEALLYSVENNLAPILTLSYGGCETQSSGNASILEPYLAQASTQGQTIMVSSGDQGAAGCASDASAKTTVGTGGLAVDYPASSPNVTAVGGSQLTPLDPTTDTTYFSASTNSYGGSAIGYIPETSWNDTTVAKSLSASTGGASALFGKPSWQTGTGVPADGKRDVPDVAFPAAAYEHGFIVCNIESPCVSGSTFTGNSSTTGAGVYGGTSVAAPNFAALLAVVEQATGNTSGLGNINSRLYTLAAGSSSTSVFHDITTGNNIVGCTGGSTGCSSTVAGTNGTMGYNAGTGYDQVTGLGSIDAANLATAIKSSTNTTKLSPPVTQTAATTTPASGTTDLLTLALSGTGAAPTGTVTLTIDGTTVASPVFSSTATSATYSYTAPACTTAGGCAHTVVASYPGDTVYNSGSATLTLTVASTSTVTPAITVTPASTAVSVTAGSSVTNAINLTSTAFAGTVSFKSTVSPSLAGCYTLPSVALTSGGTGSSTMTIYTSSANCASAASTSATSFAANHAPATPIGGLPRGGLAIVAAGALGAFFLRKRRPAALLMVLGSVLVIGLAGCGSSATSAGSTSTTTTATAGTYTITVAATGTPSTGSTTVTATTTFTLTVK